MEDDDPLDHRHATVHKKTAAERLPSEGPESVIYPIDIKLAFPPAAAVLMLTDRS